MNTVFLPNDVYASISQDSQFIEYNNELDRLKTTSSILPSKDTVAVFKETVNHMYLHIEQLLKTSTSQVAMIISADDTTRETIQVRSLDSVEARFVLASLKLANSNGAYGPVVKFVENSGLMTELLYDKYYAVLYFRALVHYMFQEPVNFNINDILEKLKLIEDTSIRKAVTSVIFDEYTNLYVPVSYIDAIRHLTLFMELLAAISGVDRRLLKTGYSFLFTMLQFGPCPELKMIVNSITKKSIEFVNDFDNCTDSNNTLDWLLILNVIYNKMNIKFKLDAFSEEDKGLIQSEDPIRYYRETFQSDFYIDGNIDKFYATINKIVEHPIPV